MKSKLKVRRIVDSFLSKDDVGFYKIEWEESWLPLDAFQHLKYLIEEFWNEKNASDVTKEKDAESNQIEAQNSTENGMPNVSEQEGPSVKVPSVENADEGESKIDETAQISEEVDQTTDDIMQTPCEVQKTTGDVVQVTEDTDMTISLSQDESEPSITECLATLDESHTDTNKTSCYFCGREVHLVDLNSHEHDHIRQNCSDVLIGLIGQGQNENVVVVDIDGDPASPCKVLSDRDMAPSLSIDGLNSTINNNTMNYNDKNNNNDNNNNNNTVHATTRMTVHHSDNKNGLSCPVCNETFHLFNDFLVHFQSHRNNPRYFHCAECGKQFVSKELFAKHTQLHVDANRRQKSYGNKISSIKSNRKAIRRVMYPRIYQTLPSSDGYASNKVQVIDLSESPFGAISRGYGQNSGQHFKDTTMFVEMLDPTRYRKRARKEAAEFSPDVLRSARQYIKAVSKRRKIIKRSRLQAQQHEKNKNPSVKTLVDGIGVDVELERSEDSLPIVSMVEGKKAYSCKICNKTFFNKFHHREHYNVHSGEMPYECEFCLKRFAQRSGWNRHIKLHHKYDVFAGPLPRFATEKPNETPTALSPTTFSVMPSMVSPVLSIRASVLDPIDNSILVDNQNEALCDDSGSYSSLLTPVCSKADISSPPMSEISRLTFENQPHTHTPSHTLPQPPTFPYRYDMLPDAVKKAMKTGITPPSFSEASFSEASTVQLTNVSVQIAKKSHVTNEKTTAFQCKKVRTMNGDLIFMIRVSAKAGSDAPNKEFAYILDDAGFVESRIFVDDYPGGDWLDFPLDETANDVLRSRVQEYDEQNRRGPKPAHLSSNRKQLPKSDSDKDSVIDTSKNLLKVSKAPASTKDIIASSSIVLTTTSAGESATTIPKSTHGRSFRSGREKRFSCNVCERKFLAQAHLNDHMLIHTGELPYKCMFCNRPFRHKSGLNSHHKRHIQRGVFNRPISSKDKVLYPNTDKHNIADVTAQQLQANKEPTLAQASGDSAQLLTHPTSSLSGENISLNASVPYPYTISPSTLTKDNSEKPKRKGRKPKQVLKTVVTEAFNGEELDSKQAISEIVLNTENCNSTVDAYKCNFCSLTFPMRTAYLKHVNREHKATNATDLNIGDFDPDDNIFSEFNETLIKEEVFDSPIDMEVGLNNGGVENLFPDVTIKEEEIDDSYLQ